MSLSFKPLSSLSYWQMSDNAVTGPDNQYFVDLCICSPDLAFIFLQVGHTGAGGDARIGAVVVNPSTGEVLNYLVSDITAASGQYCEYLRLDNDTAVFNIPGVTDSIWGTATATAIEWTAHPYVNANPGGPEHYKSTGEAVWVDEQDRKATAVYWQTYHNETGTGFMARAWAQEYDVGTRAVTEFEVLANQGLPIPADESTEDPYYGQMALSGGRAVGCRTVYLPYIGSFGPTTYPAGFQVFDNTGAVIEHRILSRVPPAAENYWTADLYVGENRSFIYQCGTTDTFVAIFNITYYTPITPGTFYWEEFLLLQRYQAQPPYDKIGDLVKLNRDDAGGGAPPLTDTELLAKSFVDAGKALGDKFRILNTPYFNEYAQKTAHTMEIGVQDYTSPLAQQSDYRVHTPATAEVAVGTFGDSRVNFLGTGSFNPDIYADSVTIGSTQYIWYLARDADFKLWFQLWSASGEDPALRMSQRDDGMSVKGHARYEVPGLIGNQASSQQHARAPRIPNYNTYT